MEVRAVPRGHTVGPIMGVILGDVDAPRHDIGRADVIDAPAFRRRSAGLDQPGARLHPIPRINVVVIGAICQAKTNGRASRDRRNPSPRRASPTPHHPPSRGNYRIRAWSDCGENRQARSPRNEWIISPALCVVHSTGDSVERTKSIRPTGNASLLERAGATLAKLSVLPIQLALGNRPERRGL